MVRISLRTPFFGLAALACLLAVSASSGTAQAGIVNINIGPTGFNIGGINGGVDNNSYVQATGFPISGNTLNLYNNYFGYLTGLQGANGLEIATGGGNTTPWNFSLNDSIGSGGTYTSAVIETAFRHIFDISPDFGPGSFMGFQTSQGNYGWLEVTWKPYDQFQIFSGAYESTPYIAILAGANAVPEIDPNSLGSVLTLVLGSLGMLERRRLKVKLAV